MCYVLTYSFHSKKPALLLCVDSLKEFTTSAQFVIAITFPRDLAEYKFTFDLHDQEAKPLVTAIGLLSNYLQKYISDFAALTNIFLANRLKICILHLTRA